MKRVSLVIIAVLFISFMACEKETVVEEQISIKEINDKNEDEVTNGKYGLNAFCFYYYEFGSWQFNPATGYFFCNHAMSGVCRVHKVCIKDIVFDRCQFIPCWLDIFDPRDVYEEVDPRVFESFRDKLDLDVNPEVSSVPFALNEKIMGLQFYAKNRLMSIKEAGRSVFYVREKLVFDRETSRNLGLQGNVVYPGEYPILINEKNKTFNVILSVEKGFERQEND